MLIPPQVAQHPLKSPCGGGCLGVPVKSAHGGSQGRTRWGRVEPPTYRERSVCRLHPCLLSLRCLHDLVQKVLAFLQPLCHFEHLCSGLHTVHAQARFEQVPDVVQRFRAGGIHREFILRQHMRYRATFAAARIASSSRSRSEMTSCVSPTGMSHAVPMRKMHSLWGCTLKLGWNISSASPSFAMFI